MKVGRKVVYALLTALILLNLLLRYPRADHELGVDSFFIHALAGALVAEGHAAWVLNPLSYFGWFPLSYPSAGPFMLAGVSALTGLNLEASILIASFALGPIGILAAFAMGREFRDEPIFALLVALFYGLAPRFLAFTLWSASTRNLFMALLPIFIWALLRTYRKRTFPNLLLLAMTFATLAATHRLVVLVFVVLVAFVLAIIVQVALRIVRIQFPKLLLRGSVRRASPHVALAIVVALALAMLFGTNVLEEYSRGEFATGEDLSVQLMNLSVSIARSAGFATALSLVGLVVITRQRNKSVLEPFLALALLGLIPTLFLRQYTGFYILPFLALFGSLGLVGIIGFLKRHRRVASVTTVVLVLGIASFSAFVLNIEIERSSSISSSTYVTGVYVRGWSPPGTMVANEGLTGIRVAVISGVDVLPVGGAGTTFQSPELLAYGFYSVEEVNQRLVQIPIQAVTIESDSLWIAAGIQAELDWVGIVEAFYGEIPARLQTRYEPTYYLELNSAPGSYLAYGNTYCSNLGLSIHDHAYRIYDNGRESLWWLHSPGISPQPVSQTRRCP